MNKGIDWEKHEPLISEECPDAKLFTYAILLIFRGWDAVILSHVEQNKTIPCIFNSWNSYNKYLQIARQWNF